MYPALRQHIEQVTGPLGNEDFDFIAQHFIPLKRRKHQFVVQAGEPVSSDFWVVKGCLKSYFVHDDGKEHILQFATENWWISDYQALFNGTPSATFVECLEDCELLTITRDSRRKLCEASHAMEHFWHTKAKLGYIAQQRRILSLLKNSAQERFEQFAEQYPHLFQRVPKKMIAAYLGVSRETLSRLSDKK